MPPKHYADPQRLIFKDHYQVSHSSGTYGS